MKDLIEAGITDLGGTGELALEIEYNNGQGEYKEAFFRLPQSCDTHDLIRSIMSHNITTSTLVLEFSQHPQFNINFPDRCEELVAVRLPGAIGGDDITRLIKNG